MPGYENGASVLSVRTAINQSIARTDRIFDSLSGFFASSISYSNASQGDVVLIGQYFGVVVSSEVSGHFETAGGLKVNILPVNGMFHGKAFGAVHDGSTDDSAAYAAAFAAAEGAATSFGCVGVFINDGITVWETGVVAELSGNHIPVKGGGRRTSVIKAGSGLTGTMLRLGQSTGVFSRFEVTGICFDMNHNAATALDMTYCRYSHVHRNSFIKPKASSAISVKMGRWVNRFFHNELSGTAVDGTSASGTPLQVPNDTTNDLQIMHNSFSNFEYPLTTLGAFHDLKIHYNTFDACERAAIFFAGGGRKASVKHNYFEQCGSDTSGNGVDIYADGGGTANYSAAIVGDWANGSSTTWMEQIDVSENEFANCYGGRLGVFSGLRGLKWEGNHALRQYSYDYAVSIVESGLGQEIQALTQVKIDQTNYNGQFSDLVELAGPSVENGHNGMRIIERVDLVRSLSRRVYDLIPPDLTEWTLDAGTVTKNGKYEGADDVFELTGGADLRWDIAVYDVSGWAGRYIRVVYLSKGTASQVNGLNFDVQVNTGSGLALVAGSDRLSGDTWIAGGRNMTLYIPKNAAAIRFRVRALSTADTCYVTQLHVDAASTELRW